MPANKRSLGRMHGQHRGKHYKVCGRAAAKHRAERRAHDDVAHDILARVALRKQTVALQVHAVCKTKPLPYSGNNVTSPKIISRPPEIICQKLCGTFIKSVETLRRSVNKNTDAPSEAEITNARRTLLSPETEPPIMTGRSGKVQGASTVSKPATNAITKSAMDVAREDYFCDTRRARLCRPR